MQYLTAAVVAMAVVASHARAAKYGEITFKNGKAQQGNFDDFPVVRIDEAPLVTNVHIVPADADTPPSGVGEPGVPPFAPH
jgi:isoquinoline 1-oxidoreductase subunit beta